MINLIFSNGKQSSISQYSSSEIEDEDTDDNKLEEVSDDNEFEEDDDYDGEMVDVYNDDECENDDYSLSDYDYTRYSYAGRTPPLPVFSSSVQLHSISVTHSTRVKLRCCSY